METHINDKTVVLAVMSEENRVVLGYRPRKYQDRLHASLRRFNCIVAHRRFGKTLFCLGETIDQLLRCKKRKPQYAYVAPSYGQAKRVAWDMFKDYCLKIPGATVNEADLRIDIPRPGMDDSARIMLLGAERPGSIRGIYLDGVVMDEYAECDPTVWSQVIRPALADREGWAIFIGTPKGRNHFWDIYNIAKRSDDWFSAIFKSSETRILPKTEIEQMRQELSEEEFAQELECSFSAALVGSYYGKRIDELEKRGQITGVSYDRAVPVDTYWDLGIGDSTAIWFVQEVGREYHIIDYIEESGKGIPEYVAMLKERGYNYGDHVLPHDAAARSLETGKTRQEAFRKQGLRTIILKRQGLEDGIEAVRNILSQCWFDKVKCKKGLEALRNYEKKWDAKEKIFLRKPKHNWASHGSDAFRYFALGSRSAQYKSNNSSLPRQADMDYDVLGY